MNVVAPIYQVLRSVLPYRVVNEMTFMGQHVANFIKYGDFLFPRSIAIEVNSHCNRRCDYCPQSINPTDVKFIEDSVFRQIVFRLKELNWKGPVDFHFYSEPLLDKKLEWHIEYLMHECQKAMPRIITNGDLLTENRVESLLKLGVFTFLVTRHPPYSEEWDENIKELDRKFQNKIHFDSILDRPMLSNRGGSVKVANSTASIKRLQGCTDPSNCQHITINGDYLFCCCDYYREHILGNVSYMSIKEAWGQEIWKFHRRQTQKSKPSLKLCKNCYEL